MYPKWLVVLLTLLSCLVFMASAAPVAAPSPALAKRLKQLQVKRGNGFPVEQAKRNYPSPIPYPK